MVSAPDDSRATLTMRLASDPIVNVQWQQGLFLVGQRTDCTLAVEGQLLSAGGQQVWQSVVLGQGKHETARVANWATAGQAEPAVRQAIEGAADDLIGRLTTAAEIARYARAPGGEELPPVGSGMEPTDPPPQ